MSEVVAQWRAVPVRLACRDKDHIARVDLVAPAIGGEDAATLYAVQHLGHVVRVNVGAGSCAEADDDDIETFFRRNQRLNKRFADKIVALPGPR
jgi:hypothetical protein